MCWAPGGAGSDRQEPGDAATGCMGHINRLTVEGAPAGITRTPNGGQRLRALVRVRAPSSPHAHSRERIDLVHTGTRMHAAGTSELDIKEQPSSGGFAARQCSHPRGVAGRRLVARACGWTDSADPPSRPRRPCILRRQRTTSLNIDTFTGEMESSTGLRVAGAHCRRARPPL